MRLRVQGIVEAGGMETFLGRTVYMDIATARTLLYLPADSASSLIVALRDGARDTAALPRLRQTFGAAGFKPRIDRWQDIGGIFSGIVSMGKVLPPLALAVILLVVALGIINTVLMSVLERTREFGTLMAIGTKRRQVPGMFLMETGTLGMLAAGAWRRHQA